METVSGKRNVLGWMAYILLGVQGILMALLASFFLNALMIEGIEMGNGQSIDLRLRQIEDENSGEFFSGLEELVAREGLFIEKTSDLINNRGEYLGIKVGILGDYEKNAESFDRYFLGQKLWSSEAIETLLASGDDENKYIGDGLGSVDRVATTIHFKFGDKIRLEKLGSQINQGASANGSYRIYGLEAKDKTQFLEDLKKYTGIGEVNLDEDLSGKYLDRGFKTLLYGLLLLANSLVLLAILVVINIQVVPILGRLVLQGWGRINLLFRLHQGLLQAGVWGLPLFVFLGLVLAEFSIFSWGYISSLALVGLLNYAMILLILFLASLPLLLIKPVDAIFNRLPKKIFIALAVGVYLMATFSTLFLGIYLDGPYYEIQENARIARDWKEISDIQVLNKVQVGNDEASFNQQSKALAYDFYSWYQSIEDQEGVAYVYMNHYSQAVLDKLRANPSPVPVPEEPFWYLQASPAYLEAQGIDLEEEIYEKIKEGQRVYLLSSRLGDRQGVRQYLEDMDQIEVHADDIPTKFTENMSLAFYERDLPEVFTWNTQADGEQYSNRLAILVIDSENMIFRENESLMAFGLENGRIKLSQEAAERFTSSAYLSRYHLDDNDLEFLPIEKYIDGLQKDLRTTIYFFGSFFLTALTTSLILLLGLVSLYQAMYREKIYIQMFLGHSKFRTYFLINLLVGLTLGGSLLIGFISQSKISMVLIVFLGLVQVVCLNISIARNNFRQLLEFLKSE